MPVGRLFRIKNIESAAAEAQENIQGFKRVLGPIDLVMLGIGGIVGAGIFALVGTAAAGDATRPGAGPALIVAFILTGLACSFSGLCYAEFASLAPISGSAYTYAYTTLGELVAWIIGWDLILEYAVGNVAVAVSWSGYFCEFMKGFGVEIPLYLATDLKTALQSPAILDSAPRLFGIPLIINIPALFIVTAISVVLVIGIKESAWFNNAMVAVKLLVLAFFLIIGAYYVRPENWHPFAPNGLAGIRAGAAVVFFAFIGFDAVSTAAEECRCPQRDLPIGILGSLAICTLIYMAVAAVLTGMVPWNELHTAEPLSVAMRVVNLNWAAGIVAFGSIVAHTAVLLVFQLGQPRILFSMARDGLLPPTFHAFTPVSELLTLQRFLRVCSSPLVLPLPIWKKWPTCAISARFRPFLIVCLGVIVLRVREPDRKRPFRTPWFPLVPVLGILSCSWLILSLPPSAWIRFGVWLVIGLIVYACYGYRHSRLNQHKSQNL